MIDRDPAEFRVRSLTWSVYVPNLLFSIGQGAAIPVIALLALDLGASPALAGLVVAARGLGTMLFDLPAGMLVARFGEDKAMVGSGIVLAGITLGIWTRPPLWLYFVLVVLMGATWAVWLLARIAYTSVASPRHHRGRVMAMLGGVARIGLLVGPLVGSLVIGRWGLAEPFLVLGALAMAASVTMAVSRPADLVEERRAGTGSTRALAAVAREHRRILLTAGSVAVVAQLLRSSRDALIPLWGDHIDLAPEAITLLFAASAAVESLFFYPVGMLMDRKGRKWAAVPSVALLSIGLAALPLSADTRSLTVVVVLMAIANGLGSGMNMTLGSDLSPATGRSLFLAIWRLVTDLGTFAGPLMVGAVTAMATLGASAVAVATVGAVGLGILVRMVPETRTRSVSGRRPG